MFPDAPTSRGNKHVQELIKAKSMGIKTAVVFIIQRCDATSFSPHWEMDPIFSNSLLEAYSKGVMIKAFCCSVDDKSIDISHEIPIFL
jgi:sugar fermentation stimulation protein A